jgi:hypothetical protein
MGSFRVEVGDKDAAGLELVRPATHAVSGRIVVQARSASATAGSLKGGPIPRAFLAFSTAQNYVDANINPDGTFSARLHSARHRVELAGMPGGYSVLSVRAGSQDASQGLVVGNADLTGVVITVGAPPRLPRLRGHVSGIATARLVSTKVQMTGPIIGSVEAAVHEDGAFEFPALTPGMYKLTLPQIPEFTPIPLVVTWNDAEIQIAVPAR